jgi:hypothetical protein
VVAVKRPHQTDPVRLIMLTFYEKVRNEKLESITTAGIRA